MPLIVKIMTDDGLADDSPYKAHSLITGVISLKFLRSSENNGSNPCVLMYFAPGEEPEYADIEGNVYVMNENGKTISSWAAPVEVPKHEKKGTIEVFLGRSRFSLMDKPYRGRDICREFAIPETSDLEYEKDDGDGLEWDTIKPNGLYYPGDGMKFREVPAA